MRHESLMLQLGTPAPDFTLSDGDGVSCSLRDVFGEKGLLVAFISNHCPFVLHLLPGLLEFAREYQQKGLGVVAVSSNDSVQHPEDGPDAMVDFGRKNGFTFPYLYDEDQSVADAYRAVCTPDFFLFNEQYELVYCGQFDDSRPFTEHSQGPRTQLPVTGESLRSAVDAMIAGTPLPALQYPSNGCSIKWKPGREPGWW
ncbi:thioredoxin family protein [Pseudomaricurvus alcaniphilus]|uniref:thioredoxin family protein n=1 Tax=Pseudomaricurvus alcaniphilus TaxID=1166482 RepID=UPI001A9F6B5D|nr:thioredoxin family protein [Pseudomaricurvus alcaniphilus]